MFFVAQRRDNSASFRLLSEVAFVYRQLRCRGLTERGDAVGRWETVGGDDEVTDEEVADGKAVDGKAVDDETADDETTDDEVDVVKVGDVAVEDDDDVDGDE